MKAVFVIDSGLSSGLGHLRRSIVLAQALHASGINCNFHVTADSARPMLKDNGFTSFVEIEDVTDADLIVVDGNCFSGEQIEKWSDKGALLCVIDDNGVRPIKADTLINPNLYAQSLSYNDYDANHLLLGPEYNLIAEGFFEKSDEKENDYLICFGGTDDGRLAGPLIKQLLKKSDKNIIWAVPSHVRPQADLVALSVVHKSFFIEVDGDIAHLLRNSKIYMGGAGTMVSEALAAKCDIVSCAIVPNQDKNVEYLCNLGFPAFKQFDAGEMVEAAGSIRLKDRPRLQMHKNGSKRIASFLVKCLEEKKNG